MGLEDAGFSCLPLNEDTTFPVMTRYGQGSNVDALYLDPGPWITQNMDQVQPPPKDTHFSSAAQSALSSCSRTPTLPTSRVKGPLPSIRQRTAQACDKCRERKTKVFWIYIYIYIYYKALLTIVGVAVLGTPPCLSSVYESRPRMRIFCSTNAITVTHTIEGSSWLYPTNNRELSI